MLLRFLFPNTCYFFRFLSLADINIDIEEENEEEIINKRRKQREELMKVRNNA